MKISLTELKTLTRTALKQLGYVEEEVAVIEEVLLYAQLRGSNQGLIKLTENGIPRNPQAGEIRILRETPLSAHLDGNGNPGMIVIKRAVDLALGKARDRGFGLAGSRGTDTSTGAIGYWARRIAREGFLGFVFTSPLKSVAPHGSCDPLLGTNPVAMGVPTEEEPLVLDLSTAAMAFYGLFEAKTAGTSIPPGIAVDRDGKDTTDPARAIEGALRTFGGHKGSGLAIMIEILAGVLPGALFADIGSPSSWGSLVFAIDPGLLSDRETFRQNVTALINRLKSARKLPGVDEILMPGERGDRLTRERRERGEIEIEDNLLSALRKLVARPTPD